MGTGELIGLGAIALLALSNRQSNNAPKADDTSDYWERAPAPRNETDMVRDWVRALGETAEKIIDVAKR